VVGFQTNTASQTDRNLRRYKNWRDSPVKYKEDPLKRKRQNYMIDGVFMKEYGFE